MALKIRLARIGRKKQPIYRIVAIDERSQRNGAALEVLGTYDPCKKSFIQFHEERILFWTGHGAVATDSVKKLMRVYRGSKRAQEAAAVAPAAA